MYGRSFNAPRRSRGTRGKPSSFNRAYEKKEVSKAQLIEGLGSEIETISVPSSTAGHSSPISIQNFEPVASYSWIDWKDATIVVPCSPRIWCERAMPYAVPRDTGTVFLDQNIARLSSSPLLPMITAVSHHAPSFPLPSVDFVTDRNGLRKLWRWAIGGEAGTFRIDVELAGTRTVLMERWEAEMTQQGGPGYEQEFEKASTMPAEGCERTSGHHRIVTYDLDGLMMLVRYKTDACVPTRKDEGTLSTVDPVDALTSGLENLSVAKPPDKATVAAFGGASLSILSRGTLVPQSSLVELKTRSVMSVKWFDWDDTYPQLFLSQTPHLFLCVHERGEFKEVRKRTLEELEREGIARKAQEGLRKLRKVLGEIRDIVGEEGEGARLSLVCERGGGMVVYERGGKEGSLPEEVVKRFRE